MWRKIQYFKIIIMLLPIVPGIHPDDYSNNVLIVTSNNYCVTNSSSGIVFNPPIDEVNPKEVLLSKFYPIPVSHEIDCNIDKGEKCTEKSYHDGQWDLEDSIDGHINQEITDRRWEELEIYKTKDINKNDKTLDFQMVSEFNKDDFVIPISIRLNEGHVLLCEGSVTNSKCYWVMLQAWGGKKSALRICNEGNIYISQNEYPEEPCKTPVIVINHAKSILSDAYWSHIKIMKKGNTITVKINDENVMLHTHENPFSPKYIYFHGKRGVGLWKLHKYTYIYTNQEGTKQLGPKVRFRRGYNCIALFTVMCSFCGIKIRLQSNKNSQVYSETFNITDEKWREIKIIFDMEDEEYVYMYVSMYLQRNSEGAYWAVDNIRQCENNEFRVLKSSVYNAPCQVVVNKDLKMAGNSRIATDQNAVCPENTFGENNCIPCMALGNNLCENFKYCEFYHGKTTCSCSSGFQNQTCNEKCAEWYYGHGCKKHCKKNCRLGCSNTDGTCEKNSCNENFTGKKCEIARAPLLKEGPKVWNIRSTSCWVRIRNFEIIGNETPLYYKIQYKKNEVNSKWINADNEEYKFNQARDILIQNLEADTPYCVRGVLYSDRKNIYTGSAIEHSCFLTNCTPYSYDDIVINASNISATISLKKGYKDKCQISNYKFRINNQTGQMIETVQLTSLEPNKDYKFILKHDTYEDVWKTFRTKEGVPSEVRHLVASNSSPDKVSMNWKEPEKLYGNVKYFIQYRLRKTISCSNIDINPTYTLNTPATSVILNDLKPYSEYEVTVSAYTTWGRGKDSSIHFETESLEDFTENEIPNTSIKDVSKDNIIVYLEPINCNDFTGTIYLKFEAKCEPYWCSQSKPDGFKYDTNISTSKIGNLTPYTIYTIIMRASRSGTDWSDVRTMMFTTKPSVPNKIEAVDVTSRNETSISLRWKPPFPPTGILTKYKIKYEDKEIEKNIEECKLWPDYHCVTIKEGIKAYQFYRIEILARNEVPNYYENILKTGLSVVAAIGVPDPPYDVKGIWTESGGLEISWKHPNATNGVVKSFQINTQNGETFEKGITSENDYNLTYTYKISNDKLKPCFKYVVNVNNHNEKFVSKNSSEVFEDWSPPPLVPNTTNNAIKIRVINSTLSINILKLMDKSKYIDNNCSQKLYILVPSPINKRKNSNNDITDFENTLRNNTGSPSVTNAVILKIIDQKDLPLKFSVENNTESNNTNSRLIIRKGHNVYLFFVNKCYGKFKLKRIEINPFSSNTTIYEEQSSEGTNKGIYALLLLILLVPFMAYLYIYKIRRKQSSERNLMTVMKKSRNKDIEEVPLSENKPARSSVRASSMNKKMVVSVPSSMVKKGKYSMPVKIIDFESYVRRSIETGELEKQHEMFPRGPTQPWDYGALKVNKSKNRYNNLIAYDHTRVKLTKIDGIEHSDYINASYIDGYRVPRAYIATQGPKPTTLNDFWRMVWQENIKHIVMLANIYEGGKKKVEKYWPNINEEIDFNGIRVQYVSSKVFANYEHRLFRVYYRNHHREVNQLHFTSWPDHGVPLYSQSLVPFLQQLLKIPNNVQSPVLVHCSAGVGRTGTIILCDICLRMAAGEGSIDVLANLEHLRSQRANMVDNIEQYKLAHLVVLECLFGMHTSIACNDDMNKTIKALLASGGVSNQIKYLSETEWQDKAMDSVWNTEDQRIYPQKNRFQDVLPDKNYRVFLNYYPTNDESSFYINAVQVDGFRSPGRFIVTQQPLPNTVGDFWRMVWEKQCTVIISLNEIDPRDKTSCNFWPENGSEINPVDYLRISHVNAKVLECYQINIVEVINQNENQSLQVNIVSMNNWMPKEVLPNSMQNFLLLWEECDILSRKSDTVIVTCYDGATASGFYIATTFLIDKMKLEQECDVCLAVRTIRHNRKEFVTSEDQFAALYKVAIIYRDGFQSYANFT